MAPKQYDMLYKILLIGDSSVGKTCLVCRFCDENFNSTFVTTIGIDFKIKTIEINKKKIKLQLWDTAGHERFHSLTTSYYRGAHGVMFVYSIDQQNSFENIIKWLRNFEDRSDATVVKILVGNKCDLEGTRVITKEQGEKMAAYFNMEFFETSAKLSINVDQAFFEMAKLIMESLPEKNEIQTESVDVENYDHENERGKWGKNCCNYGK